jgi:hypothetical protein
MKKAPPPDRVNMHPIYPMVYKKLLLVTGFKDFPNVILWKFYFNVCIYFIFVSVANYGAALELLDQPVERAHLLLSPRWIVWISPYPGIDPCIRTCFLK